MSQSRYVPAGPPYLPTAAPVGGLPTVSVDVPALAVFLALYIAFAAANMTIFQVNRRRGHKFIPSVALFGFCMARITTCSLRTAWATRLANFSLAIAAGIFVNAGILVIYIVNLVFAHRILRAKKPHLGWHPALNLAIKALYLLIVAALIMVITATILSFYTLNLNTRMIAHDCQLAAITYLLVITVLPLLLLAVAFLPATHHNEETFGEGSMQSKAVILACSSVLCIMIAGFKAGVAWETPRPISHPAWFDSKAAFYVFNFTLEIIILTILTVTRIDKRFYVPDGSNKAGDYSRELQASDEEDGSRGISIEAKSDSDP